MEGGGASSVLAIADSGQTPLAPTQKELTPLQRMVIVLGTKKMHEDAKDQQRTGGGHGHVQNKLAGGNSAIEGETVKYVNKSVNNGE